MPACSLFVQDGAEVAPGGAHLGPQLMWQLRQWTDELCNGDGYNALMKVCVWLQAPSVVWPRTACNLQCMCLCCTRAGGSYVMCSLLRLLCYLLRAKRQVLCCLA